MRVFLLLSMFLLLAAQASAEERRSHRVEAGEYLGLLATRYGVTVAQLKTWNTLENDNIRIGQSLVVSPEQPAEEARHEWETTYLVVRGDHIGRIAERVGMSRDALLAANPGLEARRLRPGQELNLVGPTRVVDHVARRGETLARLMSRYEVRHRELLEWNPALRRRNLEVGMTVRFYTSVRLSRSESLGAPNAGSLTDAEPLPAHRAYVIRNPANSFGTHETVQWIVEAFDAALDASPTMPRVRIHDISSATGGTLRGHRSHQSGRDVDIAYFRRQCRPSEPCFWSRTRPEDLDVAHTWRVMRYWLERDLATAIFVDHALQKPLYEYAEAHGATRAQLSAWFQYPREAGVPVGVIRHFPAHADHFHVRFACPRGDDTCTEAIRIARSTSARANGSSSNETNADSLEHAHADSHEHAHADSQSSAASTSRSNSNSRSRSNEAPVVAPPEEATREEELSDEND